MSSTYVACKIPAGVDPDSLTQDVLAEGPPPIAAYSAICDRLLKCPGFTAPSKAEGELGRELLRAYAAGHGLDANHVIDVVHYSEGKETIEYEFHGDPVNSIVLHVYPRRELLRVLNARDDLGPFFVFDPQTGEFLTPDKLQ